MIASMEETSSVFIPDDSTASDDPSGSLIFHVGGGPLRNLPAKVALDDAQRQIGAAGQAAGRRNALAFHETHPALHLDVWILSFELVEKLMVRRRHLAGQESRLSEMEDACANGHRHIRRLANLLQPDPHLLGTALGRDDYYSRRRRVFIGVTRHQLEAGTGTHELLFIRNGEQLEAGARHLDALKHTPRSREVDDVDALRNDHCDGNASTGRWPQLGVFRRDAFDFGGVHECARCWDRRRGCTQDSGSAKELS